MVKWVAAHINLAPPCRKTGPSEDTRLLQSTEDNNTLLLTSNYGLEKLKHKTIERHYMRQAWRRRKTAQQNSSSHSSPNTLIYFG